MKTTNIEIYNFLNLTNHRFGKLYKYSGYCPLPNDFVITKQKIKEKLLLSQMKDDEIFPSFSCEDKGKIKKNFKNCLKNCRKIKKNNNFAEFSKDFAEKIEIYFDMEVELLEMLLKEFKSHTFDEVEAFRDFFNVDPIMSKFFEPLFECNADLKIILFDLEKKYNFSYSEKLKILEEKSTKKKNKKKEIENNLINLKKSEKINGNCKKISKKADKIAKSSEKMENKENIKKTKQEIKTAKTEKNKEK